MSDGKLFRGAQKDLRMIDMIADIIGDKDVPLKGNNDLRDAIVKIAESVSPTPPTPTPTGGIRVIKSSADWSQISSSGVECATLAELATVTGIAEADLQEMFTSNVYPNLLITYDAPTYFMAPLKLIEVDDEGNNYDYVFADATSEDHEAEIWFEDGTYYAKGWGA